MTSFTNADKFIGKFGVSVSDPSQIELTINSDHTFFYQDLPISDKKIVINGAWTTKWGKVYFEDNNLSKKFHNIWTFFDNGQIAKSCKGFTFCILSKIDE